MQVTSCESVPRLLVVLFTFHYLNALLNKLHKSLTNATFCDTCTRGADRHKHCHGGTSRAYVNPVTGVGPASDHLLKYRLVCGIGASGFHSCSNSFTTVILQPE